MGVAGVTSAAAGVVQPQTWADIAERLGIPFALLLFLFITGTIIVFWLGKNVVKPLIEAELKFKRSHSAAVSDIATVMRRFDERIDGHGISLAKLEVTVSQSHEKLTETHKDVKQLKGMVGRLCRDSQEGSGNGASAAAPA